MTAAATSGEDPLAPVRGALLHAAERDAARMVAAARADAEEARSRGVREADALRDRARAQGEADGQGAVVTARRRARRRARSAVLRAQGEAYAQLRREVRAAVIQLRDEPGYPALHDRLVAEALSTLGPGATVVESPLGGVVAEAAGRRVDLTLPALADRLLDSMGAELVGLWAP
jgi:vacuolar-type H+-ATPase subunit E/Vma4